jgi:hypothetical protein
VQIADQRPEQEVQLVPCMSFSVEEARQALAAGGRIIFYEYCISLGVITLRRPSRLYLVPPGKKGVARGIVYSLVSLFLGWWGIPWGFIYTPLTMLTNLSGGRDVTAQLRPLMLAPPEQESALVDLRQAACAENE